MMTKTEEELCRCMRHAAGIRKSMLPERDAKEKARLLNLMSHPTRLQILKLLSERDLCVCVLSKLLGKGQANVSQHLSKLRDTGAIENYSAGKLVYYRISDRRIKKVIDALRR